LPESLWWFSCICFGKRAKNKTLHQRILFENQSFHKRDVQQNVQTWLTNCFANVFEVTAFAAAAFICGLISSTDIASHQIALSMASFTFNLCIGFSVASTVMIGNKMGVKDFAGLRKIGINNFKLTLIYMGFCGLMFILFRNVLPHFFTKESDVLVINLASKLMIIAALFQLSDGIQVTALGCLRGIQDVKIPSVITFLAYWVFTIPVGYFLCVTLKMGAFGMWIALESD
jgi:MATE family multidrug resistance protein